MAVFFQMHSNTGSPAFDSIISLCGLSSPNPRGTDVGMSLLPPFTRERNSQVSGKPLAFHKSCCGAASAWLGSAHRTATTRCASVLKAAKLLTSSNPLPVAGWGGHCQKPDRQEKQDLNEQHCGG